MPSNLQGWGPLISDSRSLLSLEYSSSFNWKIHENNRKITKLFARFTKFQNVYFDKWKVFLYRRWIFGKSWISSHRRHQNNGQKQQKIVHFVLSKKESLIESIESTRLEYTNFWLMLVLLFSFTVHLSSIESFDWDTKCLLGLDKTQSSKQIQKNIRLIWILNSPWAQPLKPEIHIRKWIELVCSFAARKEMGHEYVSQFLSFYLFASQSNRMRTFCNKYLIEKHRKRTCQQTRKEHMFWYWCQRHVCLSIYLL